MVKPYNQTERKKKQITKMFDNIANTYDLLNHFLSLRMHVLWRRKAIKHIDVKTKKILDIGTGTADFAIDSAKFLNADIIGVDLSEKMLEIGREKIKKKKLKSKISLELADAEKLNYSESSFDVITAGFVVRNFEDMDKGLAEQYRVLKPNGKLIILEPSIPKLIPFKQIYNLYFSYILPHIGKIISNDKSAYNYLKKSVKKIPNKNIFFNKLKNTGFKKYKHIPLSFGIVSLYIAIK